METQSFSLLRFINISKMSLEFGAHLEENPGLCSSRAGRVLFSSQSFSKARWSSEHPLIVWRQTLRLSAERLGSLRRDEFFAEDSRCSALNLENLPEPVSLFYVRQTCQPSGSTLPRLSVEHTSPFSATISWIPRALEHQSRRRPCLIPQTVH